MGLLSGSLPGYDYDILRTTGKGDKRLGDETDAIKIFDIKTCNECYQTELTSSSSQVSIWPRAASGSPSIFRG